MKIYAWMMFFMVGLLLLGCADQSDNADVGVSGDNQATPLLNWNDERYNENSKQDLTEMDGFMADESNARNEIHQGEFSDELTEALNQIDGVKDAKVIVHNKEVAASVLRNHTSSIQNEMIQVLKDRVGGDYKIFVSDDKAAYRVAQSLDNGLRSGYDEKWEHENMEYLKALMTEV
ncbi:YhcN/YlaJ family sporulation lipoprotein [Jeotgalibacillus soli]|uniref:Sporulation protein n=1 Tax=Jeotgalibacillus soli TaxID=889306 RepID=A0A0C2VKP5_9BACL|nr:YhcN/YlaJ family sporulation lipoprotein [Jeotgalibacillus soli]KIL44538.1 hypothetical protein KP78_35020 [Jeotgalibacillus soli]